MGDMINKFLFKFNKAIPFVILLSNISYAVDTSTGNAEVDDQLQTIVNIMFAIALVISTIKIIQIGIMFLLQPTGKAKAKESIFPWLIGAAICATFFTLGSAIIDIFDSGNNGDPFNI